MAYEKTIWKNREVERPRTFEKIENPDGTITLVPAEGNIIEQGTPIIAENMNKIEQGIEDAHNAIDAHKADYRQHPYYAGNTGSRGTGILQINLPVTYPNWSAVPIGACFSFKNIYSNQTVTSGIKLALAGLEGEKPILKSNGSLFTTLTKDAIYTVRWNGENFILQGEGGEYGNVTPDDVIKGVTFGTEEGLKTGTLELTGNATASQVLTGRTFYTTNPKTILTGSMPNRGAINQTLTTQGGSYTIPAGYHNGSGKVTANFANLVAENIKSGVNIGGIIGNLEPKGRVATGTLRATGGGSDGAWHLDTVELRSLPFTPKFVIYWGGSESFGVWTNQFTDDRSYYFYYWLRDGTARAGRSSTKELPTFLRAYPQWDHDFMAFE